MKRAVGVAVLALLVVTGVGAAVVWPLLSPTGGSEPGHPLLGTTTGTSSGTTAGPGSQGVTVAFVADAGMSNDTRAVFRMIKREGADAVVYSGDFDYQNDPEAWGAMLDEELGPSFPVVATIGNHDVRNWSGYQRVIRRRAARADGLQCTGDLGWRSTCTFENVTVVQSAAGICDYNDNAQRYPDLCREAHRAGSERYVAAQLSNATTPWRVCSWHLNNHAFQVGQKGTKVPLSMYDTCRRGGAIIATGHDHAYARTYSMSDFATETVASRSPPYTVGDGTTFAVVNGAAGHSFYERGETANASWWATTYAGRAPEERDGSFGAFFCTLRPDGTGDCYFETTAGDVVDGPFPIESGSVPSPPSYPNYDG